MAACFLLVYYAERRAADPGCAAVWQKQKTSYPLRGFDRLPLQDERIFIKPTVPLCS
jgi:hypothetical protein